MIETQNFQGPPDFESDSPRVYSASFHVIRVQCVKRSRRTGLFSIVACRRGCLCLLAMPAETFTLKLKLYYR